MSRPTVVHVSLRSVSPAYAKADDGVTEATASLAGAEAALDDAEAAEAETAALAGDPAAIAAEGLDPAAMPERQQQAAAAVLQAKVALAYCKTDLERAIAARRELAEEAAESLAKTCRAQLAEIQDAQDTAHADLAKAIADEAALIKEFANALRPVFGNDRPASGYGLAVRAG